MGLGLGAVAGLTLPGFARAQTPDGPPPSWANAGFGQDAYGTWADFSYGGIVQRCRWIPAGTFLLGSPDDEAERFSEEGPQQQISFAKGFWLMDTALTQGLYGTVMGKNPSLFKGDDLPVETISWDEAQAFARRVNSEAPNFQLRLPSEAEWEYACRAGSTTPFEPNVAQTFAGWNITSDEANYDGNDPYRDGQTGESRDKTVSVRGGGFAPNAWGLWHMHGNVWECCEDVWRDSHDGYDLTGTARRPGSMDAAGERHCVVRGGNFASSGTNLRCANRGTVVSGNRLGFIGARFALGYGG